MIEKFARMIGRLLPGGSAWNLQPDSTLMKFLMALADEASRIKTSANNALVESDPRTTTEMISDWEAVLGLPGGCVDLAATLADRRVQVVAKLTASQAQTKEYYATLAQDLGYEITVDDITEGPAHTFSLHLPALSTRYFRVGANEIGDRLTEFGDELLECVITLYKPAHSIVLFLYA